MGIQGHSLLREEPSGSLPHSHPSDPRQTTQRGLASSSQWKLFLDFQEMISGQRQQPLGCSQVTCNEIKTDSFSNSPFLSLRWGGESMGGKVEGAFLFPPPNVNSPGCTAICFTCERSFIPNTKSGSSSSKRLGQKEPTQTTFLKIF